MILQNCVKLVLPLKSAVRDLVHSTKPPSKYATTSHTGDGDHRIFVSFVYYNISEFIVPGFRTVTSLNRTRRLPTSSTGTLSDPTFYNKAFIS